MHLSAHHPLVADRTQDSRLVQAYLGRRPSVPPVWFMRQAGRSLPEYRALRETSSMLDACLQPELAAEITMQPVRRHGVDAAIFFSDIVIPLLVVGLDVKIVAGRGPVFASPVRTAVDIARVTDIDPDTVISRGGPIVEAVEQITALLAQESERRGEPLPLIGFAGAPFTLAAYLVEGGPSKDHLAARGLIFRDPAAWEALTGWLAEVTGRFLRLQLQAGASAGQLFDSWAGSLAPEVYRTAALPASRRAVEIAREVTPPREATIERIPLAHFGVGTGELLADIATLGVDVVGLDHRVSIVDALMRMNAPVAVQGNLDPALLFAPEPVWQEALDRLLRQGRAASAHIVNLGHGVPPETDPDVLTAIVRRVHEAS
ncbi:uroporphyrinogen decarboxylase [Microbacterium sediminicola]|uniref:Uroporphyrinogen decarboxylase n=1 Tax=Microbacterium sediminicola TaxID=415210 RepID=A0ABP4U258_9MICO